MSVVPITLTVSLCLVFTFVLFFLREHSRRRFSSPESEALLPLADETPRLAGIDSIRAAKAHPHWVPMPMGQIMSASATGAARPASVELHSTPSTSP